MADRQMLIVRCGDGGAAAEWGRWEGGRWTAAMSGTAYIGRGGTGKTREGDSRTPLGEFGVRRAFGILPDPGTRLPYMRVTGSVYACDEPGPWYNTIVDTAATGAPCGGEHMIELAPEYNYGMELDYNPGNVYPLGSAIFVHCKGSKAYTGGCVALDEDFVRFVLTHASPGLKVLITDDKTL